MKIRRNETGLTLVELLVTLAIAFVIMGAVSGVLFQSFRSMEITDTQANLRQEANIIISMISSAHLSSFSASRTYNITYKKISDTDWEISFGDQKVTNTYYDLRLELKPPTGTSTYIFDTVNTDPIGTVKTVIVDKKTPLNVKKLTLTDKKDNTKKFDISTIISRL